MYKRRVIKHNIPYSHSIEQCIPHPPPSEKFPRTGVRKWYIDLSVDGIYVGLVYLQRCIHSARGADTGTNHSLLSFIRRQASRQDILSLRGDMDLPTPSHPLRLPGQSFAIEHRMHEKKSNKFRPFLRQVLCGFRAGGLWSTRPGRSGLSFRYFTFSCPEE